MTQKQELLERVRLRKDEVYFRSRFKHISSHNGFRPEELHTFIAEKGGGKSTLMRAWVVDCLIQKKRVFIRLSEESSEAYRDDIQMFFDQDSYHFLDNLVVDSELDLRPEDLGSDYVEALDQKIKEFGADILVLDNFTTSVLSRAAIHKQEDFAIQLRKLASRNAIPVIVAAHTEKGFKRTQVATGDNIRGNMILSNTAAYIYTLTIFHDQPGRPAVLLIDKARHHSAANKKLFLLEYDQKLSAYTTDKPMEFSDLKKVLQR